MDNDVIKLKQLSKPELAATLAHTVRRCLLPDDGKWTIEAGRDCIDVLLIAARLAYPTSADIEQLGNKVNIASTVDVQVESSTNICDVASDVADKLKEELGKRDIG